MRPTQFRQAAEQVARFDASGYLDEDRACARCGYNLRGLKQDSSCPECALHVRDSLMPENLCFADPRWLRTVCRGLGLVAVALVASTGSVLLSAAVAVLELPGDELPLTPYVAAGAAVICGVGMLVGILGMIMASTPDPAETRAQNRGTARRWTRILTLALALSVALAVTSSVPVGVPFALRQWLAPICAVATPVLAFALAFAFVFLQRAFLRRGAIRSAAAAQVVLGWLTGLTILLALYLVSLLLMMVWGYSGDPVACLIVPLIPVLVITAVLYALLAWRTYRSVRWALRQRRTIEDHRSEIMRHTPP